MSESLLGGNPAPAAAPAQAPAAPPAAPVSINIPENWKEVIPEDIRQDPSLGSIKDIASLAKSYIHAQKLVGKDKIIIPDQHATDDDWKGVFKKLGLPESIDKYQIKADGFDEGFLGKFKEFAYNNNLMPQQSEKLLSFYKDFADESLKGSQEQTEQIRTEAVSGLKKEWGNAFEKNLAIAQGALKQFADKDTLQYIEESGLGNDTKMVKLFHQIGAKMGEDQFVGDAKKQSGFTPAEAQEKVNNTLGNRQHPYWDKSHPNHKNAVEEVFKLHEYIAANEDSQKKS